METAYVDMDHSGDDVIPASDAILSKSSESSNSEHSEEIHVSESSRLHIIHIHYCAILEGNKPLINVNVVVYL